MLLRHPISAAATALAGYLLIAFLLTLHAWSNPTHSWTGGPGDPYKFMDFLGWIPHQIASGHNPLLMSAIDAPYGVNLAWETPVPLAAILTWPITATLGVVAAYNVWIALALALDGWCTYLWLRGHTQRSLAAFVGGALLAAGPYAYAHATGHLNLVSFFPIPLVFIAVERLVRAPGLRWRLGIAIGALMAAQLYFAEELVVQIVIAVGVALVVAALLNARRTGDVLRGVLPTAVVSVGVLAVLAAPLLAMQFLGPRKVHGRIQPTNVYVTDVANLVLPTKLTWLQPLGLSAQARAAITAHWAEPTAYVGVFLLALTVYAAIRWWRVPFVRVALISTVVIEVLSFGPTLHVASDITSVPLPSQIFTSLPLLENLIPGRLSLLAEFGFAFFLALTLDRTLFSSPRRGIVGSALAVLAVVTVAPAGALASSTAPIPGYFTSNTGARALPPGTVALVGPYVDNGTTDAVSMLWQAESDYHISLIDALAITVNQQDHVSFLEVNAIFHAFSSIQLMGVLPPETSEERQQIDAVLQADHVSLIVLGPMQHRNEAVAFVSWLTAMEPQLTDDVAVWRVAA